MTAHEKKLNWGIVGLLAAILPSVIAVVFVFLPNSISRNSILIVSAVIVSIVSMTASLIISVIAHAQDMEGKHWSILGVCILPSPFLVLVIVSMISK